jgi:aldose 1-epimerase
MRSAIVHIGAGDLELGLVPELGGSVAYLRLKRGDRSIDLLRRLSEADRAAGDVLGVAMFPMVPYANCIEGNVFEFDGHRYHVEPNLPPYKFNFHGSGWQLPWTVAETGADRATLTLKDDHPSRPHRYAAAQQFVVDRERLVVTTTVTNIGLRRMPFGFGQHPWFPRRERTLVRFAARRFWIESPDISALEAITIPPELDFASLRSPPAVRRNNCYEGWSGGLEVSWPDEAIGLRLTAEPVFRHLMVYFPAAPSAVFCLEPQTNLISAFTRADVENGGTIILEPGQSASGAITFSPYEP